MMDKKIRQQLTRRWLVMCCADPTMVVTNLLVGGLEHEFYVSIYWE